MGTCWPDRFPQGSSAVRVLRGWFLLMLLLPLLLFSLYIAVAFCTKQNLSTSNALQETQTRRIRNTVSKLPSGWVAMFLRPRSLSLPPCVVGFAPSSVKLGVFLFIIVFELTYRNTFGGLAERTGFGAFSTLNHIYIYRERCICTTYTVYIYTYSIHVIHNTDARGKNITTKYFPACSKGSLKLFSTF